MAILFVRALLIALCVCVGQCASAQTGSWPSHPIRLVVAAPPGSSLDFVARVIAEPLRQRLGQPLIVDNRATAGGITGTEAVAKSPPDGYTVLLSFTGPLALAPYLYAKLGYDQTRDLTPVILASTQPNVLVVNPQLPIRNVAELLAFAKAHPGQLNYASVGNGSSSHLTMAHFKQLAGIDIVHIPYNGAPPAVTAVAGGDAQLLFAVPVVVLPQIANGKLKALAVSSPKRFPLLPDVPTLAESGFPHFESLAWNGIMLPAGTPSAVVDRLNREINSVFADPAIRERLRAAGLEPGGGTPQEFAAMMRRESDKWAPVIRETGARVD